MRSSPVTVVWLSLIFTFLLVPFGEAGAVSSDAASSFRFKKYENMMLGVTVQYPTNWQVQEETQGGIDVRFLSGGTGSANIAMEELPVPMSLRDYTESAIQQLKSMGAKPGIPRKTKLAMLSAYTVISTKEEQGANVTFQQVWVIKGQRAYIMTMGSASGEFKLYEKTFKTMLRSFAFIMPPKRRRGT